MLYLARSRYVVPYLLVLAGTVSLIWLFPDKLLPFPNWRLGPLNHLPMTYLLAALPALAWLAVAQTSRFRLEDASTRIGTIAAYEWAFPMATALICSVSVAASGRTHLVASGRNIMIFMALVIAVRAVTGTLPALLSATAYVLAAVLLGTPRLQVRPDEWALIVDKASVPRDVLVIAGLVALGAVATVVRTWTRTNATQWSLVRRSKSSRNPNRIASRQTHGSVDASKAEVAVRSH